MCMNNVIKYYKNIRFCIYVIKYTVNIIKKYVEEI